MERFQLARHLRVKAISPLSFMLATVAFGVAVGKLLQYSLKPVFEDILRSPRKEHVQLKKTCSPGNMVQVGLVVVGGNSRFSSGDGFVGIAALSLARISLPDAFLCSIGDVKFCNTFDQRARKVVPAIFIELIFSTTDGKIKAWLYDNMGLRVDYDAPGHPSTTMAYSAN